MRTIIGVLSLVGLLTVPGAGAAQSTRYKVIVNAGNPATVLRTSELARIFLCTATIWPGGTPVLAVDQADGTPIRQTFVRDVIGKDSVSLSRYWEQAIFAGRAVPPPTMATDADIVDFVRRNLGAIGYVAASTPLGPDTKTISVVR
jgi:ABC-type phosphate transport system substrate-binding protein